MSLSVSTFVELSTVHVNWNAYEYNHIKSPQPR